MPQPGEGTRGALYSFGRGWRTAWYGADCKAPEYICTYNPLGDADLSKVTATLSAAAAAPKWTMVYTGGSEVVNKGTGWRKKDGARHAQRTHKQPNNRADEQRHRARPVERAHVVAHGRRSPLPCAHPARLLCGRWPSSGALLLSSSHGARARHRSSVSYLCTSCVPCCMQCGCSLAW